MPRGGKPQQPTVGQEKTILVRVDYDTAKILFDEAHEFNMCYPEIVAKALKLYHEDFESRRTDQIKKLRKKTEAAIKKLEIEKQALLMQLQELVV